ncbi:hypothetical protein [Kineococcus aurantiacus]|uniref:Uncharacterized protein n=2 Tax=Kineococcus aurantiacus TaxID=37633 RepID=A0A7Y9DQQ5_9ACTN|nr:hypothetical protein [Kineococcus aurantiacus]NYD25039.1 hypothetical protein [Kineococcus aurantiacus]
MLGEDMQRSVTSLDEVEMVTLAWASTDGSAVTGSPVNRPQAGRLRIEHCDQAGWPPRAA